MKKLGKGCFGSFGTHYRYIHYFLWENQSWLTTNFWVTTIPRERIEFVSQGPTAYDSAYRENAYVQCWLQPVFRRRGRWNAYMPERKGQIFTPDSCLFWRCCSRDVSTRHVRMERRIYGKDVRNSCSEGNANMSFVWMSDRRRWRPAFPADSSVFCQQMPHVST
jgi:hypothetical protein